MRFAIIGLISLLHFGCAAQTEYVPKVVDTSCLWAKPIYLDVKDSLTSETMRQILGHNLIYNKRCVQKT